MQISQFIISHCWIIYGLFFNGILAVLILRKFVGAFDLFESVESFLLSSFFISISLNFILAWLITRFSIQLHSIAYVLYCISLLGIIFIISRRSFFWSMGGPLAAAKMEVRYLVYLFVFVILLYNGGMIDQITDAWYHLSLANKINQFNSLDVNHHLTGVASYNYPKLWHTNLAVLQQLSDIPLPVLWNSFTAWGGVLKVSAFYIFALRLSRCHKVANISVLLFVLLPGLGPSFLRVSAWPAHISYCAWFFLLSIIFSYFDSYERIKNDVIRTSPSTSFSSIISIQKERVGVLLIAFLLLGVIYFSHRVELVWCAFGVFFYALSLCINDLLFKDEKKENPITRCLLTLYLRCSLCSIICFTLIYSGTIFFNKQLDTTQIMICCMVITLCLIFFFIDFSTRHEARGRYIKIAWFLLIIACVIVLVTFDWRHLYSLFRPDAGYPRPVLNELPHFLESWAGGRLKLPSWHMQLRGGLLLSGALSVLLSVLLLFFERNRLTLFLAANCVFPFCFLISPYLYTWLSEILRYHSSWRISLLIFAPIVIAYSIVTLSRRLMERSL